MKQSYNSVLEVRDQLQKKFDRARKNVLCENNWKKFDLGCYFFSKLTKNWNQSREFCISKGGDLAVLNSKEEQAFVNGWLKTSQNAWIGLFDIETEGTWKWVDGTVVTTTYWQPGQPNSYGGNQDCGEILQDSGGVGQWNDDACTADQTWVCEK
ncbi:unnamed protein product [Tetraodon nigroviridis]|uniref:Chromosome 20 SCAF14744, whole genome shotgun sequence n=1 Tax=Tetraodon nigroviridis TaxID=99883 RepID=Q4S3U4_TETNG|nr:unnamed protein product [Tetraodon nigroviridis]